MCLCLSTSLVSPFLPHLFCAHAHIRAVFFYACASPKCVYLCLYAQVCIPAGCFAGVCVHMCLMACMQAFVSISVSFCVHTSYDWCVCVHVCACVCAGPMSPVLSSLSRRKVEQWSTREGEGAWVIAVLVAHV